MLGSSDKEKGPVHFRDFDDDGSSYWNMKGSFHNLPRVNSWVSGRVKKSVMALVQDSHHFLALRRR